MITTRPVSSRRWVFGSIPPSWRAAPLKHLCRRSSQYGANIAATAYVNDGVRLLRTTDIRDDGTLRDGGVCVRPADVASYMLSEGDLLLSRSGTVGRAYVYRSEDGPCAYAGYLVRYTLHDLDSTRWLFHLTKSPAFQQWLGTTAVEATIGNISGEKYANLLVPVPPPSQQRAIVDELDREVKRLDKLISAKKHVLRILAEKQRALITRAVTRGLDPAVRLREFEVPWLGPIPAHWDVWKLGHAASIGNGSTPRRGNADYWDAGTIPWLNSSVVNEQEATHADQFVTRTALQECHLPLVTPGSVLIAITGQGKTRGRAVVLSFTATINQHLAYVTSDPCVMNPWFLRWTLLAAYDFLRRISDGSGGTKGALTCEDVANLRVPVPPIDEQLSVVSHITKTSRPLDDLCRVVKEAIDLLKERRNATIAGAVTGRIGLGNAA